MLSGKAREFEGRSTLAADLDRKTLPEVFGHGKSAYSRADGDCVKFRRATAVAAVAAVLLTLGPRRPVIAASKAVAQPVDARDLREWLTYIASDDLQGRAVFGTGIGLAASYIEDHLRAWGVKPAGDRGSYLQTVRIVGVKATSHSSVTVEVGGERRTFADGDGIRFPRNVGAKQQKRIDRVEFVGYGLDVPAIERDDYRGQDVAGAAVIWLGA